MDEQPKAGPRPKTLADVPLRFPPPPDTRFYVGFSADYHVDWPPYEEMLTVVADNPQEAIEKILRDGKGPTDPHLKCANVVWFNHNGRARWLCFWLARPDDVLRTTVGLLSMPPSKR